MCFNIAATQRPNGRKSPETNADDAAKPSCQSAIKAHFKYCFLWWCGVSSPENSGQFAATAPTHSSRADCFVVALDDKPMNHRHEARWALRYSCRVAPCLLYQPETRESSRDVADSAVASASRRTSALCVCLLVWFAIKGVSFMQPAVWY